MHLNLRMWPKRPLALAAFLVGMVGMFTTFSYFQLGKNSEIVRQLPFLAFCIVAGEGFFKLTYNHKRNLYIRWAIRNGVNARVKRRARIQSLK